MRYSFIYVRNRPSPANEQEFIEAYKKVYPSANNRDNYDISAVETSMGIKGHGLMHYSYNRSNDNVLHECYDFISDDELIRYL